jgi:HAD superfamily hydrolase (TIGR01509 family)
LLAWRDAITAAGHAYDSEYFTVTFGQRNDTILRGLVLASGVRPLPGVERWLAALHAAGWRQAIASSAPRANIEAVLAALGIAGYFEASVASEDVTHGKPDPQVYLLAAARVGTEPARCVVVEDSPFGVEGARRAGMRSVGVGPNCTAMSADLAACSLDRLAEDAFERLVQSFSSTAVG